MLNTSNEEVENLRRRMSVHQPADDEDEVTLRGEARPTDLRQELNRANSQELHVHHHYHAAPTAPKTQPLRKPKKKRYSSLLSGYATPPSRSSTPHSSFSCGSPTSMATILQQTSASVPRPVPKPKRWSVQSQQTYHSMLSFSGPSSPQSTTNRTSSLFDRVFSDAGQDSSRPTTPGTEDPGSPTRFSFHSKRSSVSSYHTRKRPSVHRGRPSLDAIMDDSLETLGTRLSSPVGQSSAIPEETVDWNQDFCFLMPRL